MAEKNIPAISVIIPMYNVEKYVGFCLDSLLAQTLQDFEVIIVDDCSTDKSCDIAENYKSSFAGKLKLLRTKKNSGGGGTPRNIGVKNSRGEYLFFLDSDDFITDTALEELYTVAKDFDADVADCQKYFAVREDQISIRDYLKCEPVKKPTLISDDLKARVNELVERNFINTLWTKLIRRKFFVGQNLQVLNILGEDMVITCCLVCAAKKYLRVPNIVNFYRIREDSSYNKQFDIEQAFQAWLKSIAQGFKYLDEFLSRQEFFKENVHLKFPILERLVQEFDEYLMPFYEQISAYQLDAFIRDELSRAGDTSALTAFLFSRMNLLNLQLIRQQKLIRQLQK